MADYYGNDEPGFVKPGDIHTWFRLPHCGSGSTNTKDICGFCGETNEACAKELTEEVRKGRFFYTIGVGNNLSCGGSGFWCPGCNRFYAQDSCGNYELDSMVSTDGANPLSVEVPGEPSHRQVSCICGYKLGVLDESHVTE